MMTMNVNTHENDPYLGILKSIIDDIKVILDVPARELDLDFKKISSRYKSEGLNFLQAALPMHAKALYSAFATGRFQKPLGFKSLGKGDSRPKLFGTLYQLIVEKDGTLKQDVDQIAITSAKCIVQITKVFYTMQGVDDLPQSKVTAKMDNWFAVEDRLSHLTLSDEDEILKRATELTAEIFDQAPLPASLRPKNGPGCVAEVGVKGNQKLNFDRVPHLNAVFPYHVFFQSPSDAEFCLPILSECHGIYFTETMNYVQYKKDYLQNYLDKPLTSPMSRLAIVPKDSRGPRIIQLEPKEYMWIQQGLKDLLYPWLESECEITRGYINFTRQEINRQLAIRGSLDGQYATLDMKDASDSISLQLIERLFRDCPTWLRALKGCRTQGVVIPGKYFGPGIDDITVNPYKFSPMGSALTFPLEALAFFVLGKAIAEKTGLEDSKIWVYGDDIITSPSLATQLMRYYPNYGLFVNEEKSFVRGPFRESCGMDSLRGVDISPVKMHTSIPCDNDNLKIGDGAKKLQSLVSLVGLFWEKGFKTAARYVRDIIVQKCPSLKYLESPSYSTAPVVCFPPLSLEWDMYIAMYEKNMRCSDDYLYDIIAPGQHAIPEPIPSRIEQPYFCHQNTILGDKLIPRKVPDVGCLNPSAELLAGLLNHHSDYVLSGGETNKTAFEKAIPAFRVRSKRVDIASFTDGVPQRREEHFFDNCHIGRSKYHFDSSNEFRTQFNNRGKVFFIIPKVADSYYLAA